MPQSAENQVIRIRPQRFTGEVPPSAVPGMQLVLILHGSGKLVAGESSVEVEVGDVVSIRPGVVYRINDASALQVISCQIMPTTFREAVGSVLDGKALSVLLDSSPLKRYPISMESFRAIAALLGSHPAGQSMGNTGRMLLLLETIVEHCKETILQVHRGVFQAVQKFDRCLDQDWTLTEVAAAVDLDPSYIARLFTSNVGSPPLAYLAVLRSEEAAVRLLTQPSSCSAIGAGVGWNDPNYFSRRFRQHFGMSPTAFRERFTMSNPVP